MSITTKSVETLQTVEALPDTFNNEGDFLRVKPDGSGDTEWFGFSGCGCAIPIDTILLSDGTATAPSLSFQNENNSDTGIYRDAENSLSVSAGGLQRLQVTQANVTVGTVSNNADLIVRGNILTAGIGVNDGSAAAPSLTFSDDTNTGIYSRTADTLNIATNGIQRVEVNGTDVEIGTTTNPLNLIVRGKVEFDGATQYNSQTITFPNHPFTIVPTTPSLLLVDTSGGTIAIRLQDMAIGQKVCCLKTNTTGGQINLIYAGIGGITVYTPVGNISSGSVALGIMGAPFRGYFEILRLNAGEILVYNFVAYNTLGTTVFPGSVNLGDSSADTTVSTGLLRVQSDTTQAIQFGTSTTYLGHGVPGLMMTQAGLNVANIANAGSEILTNLNVGASGSGNAKNLQVFGTTLLRGNTDVGATGSGNSANLKVWGDLEYTGTLTGTIPPPSTNNLTLTGTTQYERIVSIKENLVGTTSISTGSLTRNYIDCNTSSGNVSITLIGSGNSASTNTLEGTRFKFQKMDLSNSIRIVGLFAQPTAIETPMVTVGSFNDISTPNIITIIPANYKGSFELVRVDSTTNGTWRVENLQIFDAVGVTRTNELIVFRNNGDQKLKVGSGVDIGTNSILCDTTIYGNLTVTSNSYAIFDRFRLKHDTTAKSSDFTLSSTNKATMFIDTSSSNVTITLPNNIQEEHFILEKRAAANSLILTTSSGTVLQGSAHSNTDTLLTGVKGHVHLHSSTQGFYYYSVHQW